MSATRTQIDIVIIANKAWEAEPLVHAFLEPHARPETVAVTRVRYTPPFVPRGADGKVKVVPRLEATCEVLGAVRQSQPKRRLVPTRRRARVQVWCLEDLLPPTVNPSSSPAKWLLLKEIFAAVRKRLGRNPDLVVAFGTAGIPSAQTFNGCVAIGTRCLVHDPFAALPAAQRVLPLPHSTATEPMWSDPRCDQVLPSTVGTPKFNLPATLANKLPYLAAIDAAEARLLAEPNHPARDALVFVNNAFGATSTVNVVDYGDYIWADAQSQAVYRAQQQQSEIASSETTHGLIRLAAEDSCGGIPPFLFCSGLTDSSNLFDMEVTPRVYAQNFVAAHNAGMALVWLVPQFTVLLPP